MRANNAVNTMFNFFRKNKDLSDADLLQHLNDLYLAGYGRGYESGRRFDKQQGKLDLSEKS